MSDTVEQIKSRLDILDVVSGYLKVQKAGINAKARCPFHNEKTPSFYISPERQSWHCFGCNKGGDMFSFVQEIEGIDFVETLRILAGKAGVQLPRRRSDGAPSADTRGPLLAVAERSAEFFEKQLWHSSAGAKALAYLRERGLTEATITAWRLGWAPNDWRALTGFLREEQHASASIVGAGMGIEKNGHLYDRFRSRIMFPIRDANAQVVGFTGRVFGSEVAVDGEPLAKYVNTPQTAIYDKSRVLFGLDTAKMDMRRRDACLLVEGNVDALMSWQAGATNVVATSGTALTPHQLRVLSRYSANLQFCFDTDRAGQAATRRGIGLALGQGFTVSVLTIGDAACKDPADYVKKYGNQWNDVVAGAKPALQYYYDAAVASYDPRSVQSKKSVVASLAPLINRLTSKVEQSHWVDQIALLVKADRASVWADVASVRDDIAPYERQEAAPDRAPDTDRRELPNPHSVQFLGIVTACAALRVQAQELGRGLVDARVQALLDDPRLLEPGAEHPDKDLVNAAAIQAGILWQDWQPEQLGAELVAIANRLRVRHLKAENDRLAQEIQHAETSQDAGRRDELVQAFQHNSRQIQQLQT